jgi:hypothetical protein
MSEAHVGERLLMQRTFRLSLDVTIEITDNTEINLQDAAAVTDVQERLWLRHYLQDQKELLGALLANPEMRDLFLKTLVLRKVESIPETRLQKEVLNQSLQDEEILGAVLDTLPDVVQTSFQNNDKGWSLAGAEQFHESFNATIVGISLSDITEPESAEPKSAEPESAEPESAEPESAEPESAESEFMEAGAGTAETDADEIPENEVEPVPLDAGDEL